MKRHSEYGKEALSSAVQEIGDTSFLKLAEEIAYTHHEKWDGSGYPQGLKGEEIPLSGRLMAIADVYDALISVRPYKRAFTHEEATEIIIEGKGKHFDPVMVDAFISIKDLFHQTAVKFQDS